MRAAIYARQSQDREGLELGVSRQREDCERLCRERGWDVQHVLVENDTSASGRKPRPKFEQLLALIDARAIDVVVVWHADRLVRRMVDLEDVIERCQKSSVNVVTVTGDLDLSTDSGRLVARILVSVARAEMERKSARQQRAQEQAAASGRRIGGRRPFGYDDDGMTVRPDEAAAIRTAYQDALAGASLASIARQWNAAGLRSGQNSWKGARRGQPTSWTHDTVRLVLLNPRNAGLRRYKGEIVGTAVWPALVTEDVWRATVDMLTHPGRFSGKRSGEQLLTGLATCGVEGCGLTVHGGGATHKQPIYRCRSGRHVSRKAEPVDEYIRAVVIARLSREDAADLLTTDDTGPDAEDLRSEILALRKRLETLAEQFADGVLTDQQMRAANLRVRSRIAEVEGLLADAGRVNILGPLINSNDVAATWDGLDVSRQRAVVDTLMEVRLHLVGAGTRTFKPETVELNPR